jgi:hypothetical protein
MVSECLATVWWCLTSGIVDERPVPEGWSASVLQLSLVSGGLRGTWSAVHAGLVLAHCWVLRDHTILIES